MTSNYKKHIHQLKLVMMETQYASEIHSNKMPFSLLMEEHQDSGIFITKTELLLMVC